MERRWRKVHQSRKKEETRPEQGILFRLLICLGLFLMVFLGRGVFPTRTEEWREQFLAVIRQDTDFAAVLGELGQAVAEGAPVLETLDQVWIELFGGEDQPVVQPQRTAALQLRMEVDEAAAGRKLKWEKPGLSPATEISPIPKQTPSQRDLGLANSVTPVMGVLTSGFGIREHPISGEDAMHDGVDLAAETGTAILAFADGKVDYIGESKAYGQYLQLRHANGVTTFYAHCSQLCVQKGQSVTVGEMVAKVGATGNATGPHLHLEMKKDGKFVDPLPYIDYLLE